MINFRPDTSSFNSYYERGKYILAWRLSIVFSIVFGLLSVLYIGRDTLIFGYYFIVFIASIITYFVLTKTKKHIFIYWIFSLLATTVVTLSMLTIHHTLHYSDFLWMICIITFSFIGLGRKIGLLFLIIITLISTYFILFLLNTHSNELMIHTTSQLAVVAIEIAFAFIVFSYLIHQYLVFQRYAESELTLMNNQLEKQNNENIYLVKEVHHRVKNNLQIIVSLLKMQRDELTSESSKKDFSDAINRIMTIALVHDKLYAEKELTNIDLVEYLNELVLDISQLSSNPNQTISVNIKSELKQIGLKTIIPLGLLVNELLTNSYKHAFENQNTGEIYISFIELGDNKLRMSYKDNGVWKENNRKGFGMELIELLTQQLDGSYTKNGSEYLFDLYNLDY